MNNEHYDYMEAGFRVFGLLGKSDHSGIELPIKEQFKKPWASNWQHTPQWSEEQVEVMEEMGQFNTGFGVLCDGYLIIDIDPRNGGAVDQVKEYYEQSKYIVSTGGGGWHIYFKAPENTALVSHLDQFKGIDFKSTGYVVGAGSMHNSGNEYESIKGFPHDIEQAPESLIKLLKKPDRVRVKTSLGAADINESDIKEMLSFISPDIDYDNWIKVGMAIHHGLGGNGFELWDEWSSKGEKYKGELDRHWYSFGKSSNPVTLATLVNLAEANGYKQAVEFESDIVFKDEIINIDLKRPPGFVGELTDWINSQCRFPRENLAVAAAIQVVGNIAGLRYIDDLDGITSNMMIFCIADSATGKEDIQQSYLECLKTAGMTGAVHGSIKSEQEIIRNMTRHQSALYSIDELGIVLKKIVNASSKGGATYLEGVIGLIMSAYSKANAFLPIGGDLKDDLKKSLLMELAQCEKAEQNNEGDFERRKKQITFALDNVDSGIPQPFLSMIGYTTPVTFNELVDFETATNGFIGRSMLFNEPESNPKRKKCFKKGVMTDYLKINLQALYGGDTDRIEHYGDKTPIKTTGQGAKKLDDVYQYFWEMAEDAKENGLAAIPRRGYELVAKISFILAIVDGARNEEHITWAFELVKNDIDKKIKLAMSNISAEDSPIDSIAVKIQSVLESNEDGETQGVIINRCRPHKKEAVLQVLDMLVDKKLISKKIDRHKVNKREITKYKAL